MAVELAPSALPYVAWSSASYVVIPAAQWEFVFGSMQALKGHVQEYPGCQKLEGSVQAEPDGSVHVHCYTTGHARAARGFLERVHLERGCSTSRKSGLSRRA